MRTQFSAELLATDAGSRANEILRSCVHCGFCNATCPTYQLTGDELDGPRGRIYLIKDMLESGEDQQRVIRHLDRCLTCRACESTCPSDVQYGELAEIARNMIGPKRSGFAGIVRTLMRTVVPKPRLFAFFSAIGRLVAGLLPSSLAQHIPRQSPALKLQSPSGERSVIVLQGCVQRVATGETNIALAQILADRGIGLTTLTEESCCGSLDLHLGAEEAALSAMRRNVDSLSTKLSECDAIISTASGCGVTVKEYGRLLAHDPVYAQRAQAVAEKTVDAAEYLANLNQPPRRATDFRRVAFHAPCSLQHGQKLTGIVEPLLEAAGYELVPVADEHLCCGSAGTYSLLQPEMSEALKKNKLKALQAGSPEVIASANVGCQMHLDSGTKTPVVHWLQLLK